MEIPKTVMFNGRKFWLSGSGRYYLSWSTTNAGRKRPKGLHVAVWEAHHGREVPPGHEVHHKDSNTLNNDPDNLECLSHEQHAAIPRKMDMAKNLAHLERIRPLTKQWHRSEEGKEWLSKISQDAWERKQPKDCICAVCGKTFQSRAQRPAQYCSAICSYEGRRAAGRYRVERTCIVCNATFTTDLPINPSRVKKTCSRKCAWGVRNLPATASL